MEPTAKPKNAIIRNLPLNLISGSSDFRDLIDNIKPIIITIAKTDIAYILTMGP